jgi:hypothetical protein
MAIRKMAGWCLILLGIINVLHSIHLHAVMGQQTTTLNTIVTSLLFTVGAAFLFHRKNNRRSSEMN